MGGEGEGAHGGHTPCEAKCALGGTTGREREKATQKNTPPPPPRSQPSLPVPSLPPIQGVTRGFLVYLRITGIGYRASLAGQTLTLKLGHSHDCTYTLPPSLRAVLPEPTRVGIYGIDKNQVTQAAANIAALRPPSVYKGKGVRLEGVEVRLKPGKRK